MLDFICTSMVFDELYFYTYMYIDDFLLVFIQVAGLIKGGGENLPLHSVCQLFLWDIVHFQ